jgi:hypothetical protein
MVLLARKSTDVRSYTVHICSSGQPLLVPPLVNIPLLIDLFWFSLGTAQAQDWLDLYSDAIHTYTPPNFCLSGSAVTSSRAFFCSRPLWQALNLTSTSFASCLRVHSYLFPDLCPLPQDDTSWNISIASGTCLGLAAKVVEDDIVPMVGGLRALVCVCVLACLCVFVAGTPLAGPLIGYSKALWQSTRNSGLTRAL